MTTPSRDLEGVTACFGKAGLAEGTSANTIKTNAPNGAGTDYAINGYGYHKADTDNIAMTALTVQPDLYTCLYGVDIDASGTVSMVKGTQVLTAALTGGDAVLKQPAKVDGKCRLGMIKIATSGGTFTCGSTDLSAAGVTATYYDFVGGGPVQPRTS